VPILLLLHARIIQQQTVVPMMCGMDTHPILYHQEGIVLVDITTAVVLTVFACPVPGSVGVEPTAIAAKEHSSTLVQAGLAPHISALLPREERSVVMEERIIVFIPIPELENTEYLL